MVSAFYPDQSSLESKFMELEGKVLLGQSCYASPFVGVALFPPCNSIGSVLFLVIPLQIVCPPGNGIVAIPGLLWGLLPALSLSSAPARVRCIWPVCSAGTICLLVSCRLFQLSLGISGTRMGVHCLRSSVSAQLSGSRGGSSALGLACWASG